MDCRNEPFQVDGKGSDIYNLRNVERVLKSAICNCAYAGPKTADPS